MSDLAATGLILAVLIGGQFSYFLSLAKVKQWGDEIATGVAQGVQISARHRRMMLWNTWVPLTFFLGGYVLLLAAGIALVAQGIGNEHIRSLGYLMAFFCSLSFVGTIGVGTVQVLYLSSVLRQAEQVSAPPDRA
jgi:hypothetical protein